MIVTIAANALLLEQVSRALRGKGWDERDRSVPDAGLQGHDAIDDLGGELRAVTQHRPLAGLDVSRGERSADGEVLGLRNQQGRFAAAWIHCPKHLRGKVHVEKP